MFSKLLKRLSGAWKSLTIWFNGTGFVLLQTAIEYPELKVWLLDHNFLTVWFIGNVLLRFKTNSDLADK